MSPPSANKDISLSPLSRSDRDVPLASAFARRTTHREFTSDPLRADELADVLAGALCDANGWAYPSAHDRRPLTVTALLATDTPPTRTAYVLDPVGHLLRPLGREIRDPLAAVAYDDQPWLDVAPLVLAVEADIEPMAREFADQDSSDLRGRDFVMLEAGGLAQSILLGTAAADLAAVLVGGLRQEACQVLLGTERHVCSLIAVGRPASTT